MESKYLFFYLKTGNGHFAPAKAIANKISENTKGEVSSVLVDGLENASTFVKKTIEDGYRNSINKAKWVFEFLYLTNKINIVARLSAAIVSFFVFKHIEKTILENNSPKIVVLHFFLIKPIIEVLKKHNLNTRVLVVVTDPYTAHPIWFLNKDLSYIVFSEDLKQNLIHKKKIAQNNIEVFSFALDDKFSNPLSETEVICTKLEFGFRLNSKMLLILGGGEGIPNGKEILKQLKNIGPEIDIAIVCGRNKNLYKQALLIKKEDNLSNLKIYEYVDFIYKLINVSDIVLTKCGASTFMEILMMKKIPIINNYIWEQELGNLNFVKENKFGVYEKNIKKLPQLINEILENDALYHSYKENIRNASLENGTEKVANYIQKA